MVSDLTAIVLTKNEENNILDCIKSIHEVATRIVVVDSFSTDKTVEIARREGAEVVQRKFDNYAKQYAYGVDWAKIDTVWILRIDADERLTNESRSELATLCDSNNTTDVTGIELRFKKNFLGKDLYHGGVYPWRKMNCYKAKFGEIEQREMDEHIVLTQGRVVKMKTDSEHLDFRSLDFFIDKHNWYSTRETEDYFRRQNEIDKTSKDRKTIIKEQLYYKLPSSLRAYVYYLYRYYIRLGFLDGKPGKIYAFLQAYWYRFLVDAKIYEHEQVLKASGRKHQSE